MVGPSSRFQGIDRRHSEADLCVKLRFCVHMLSISFGCQSVKGTSWAFVPVHILIWFVKLLFNSFPTK
jgi:hypothetical protein